MRFGAAVFRLKLLELAQGLLNIALFQPGANGELVAFAEDGSVRPTIRELLDLRQRVILQPEDSIGDNLRVVLAGRTPSARARL